jgi:hypothetical protein
MADRGIHDFELGMKTFLEHGVYKPLPLMRRKQRLYFKEALLLWLQRESGLSSAMESTDDWEEIVRQRLSKETKNGKI